MKKRIICTVTNDLNYDQRMIRICTSLVQAGYAVTLVGRKRKKSQSLATQVFEQERLNCFFDGGKFFYIEYNIRLFFYLLFVKCEAICGVDLDTILPAYAVGRLRSKAVVYDAHEYFTEVPEVVHRPMIKRIWEGVARATIPRIAHGYTVGDGLARIFSERYGLDFGVVRNVPFKKINSSPSPLKKQEKNILLYQGALNEGRGIEALLQAMKRIQNAQLWLAGEGDLSQQLRQLASDLDINDRVTFLGYLRPPELKKVTDECTIGLNLLENKGLSYYYSLANKAFDYIQAGKPSINMDFPEYNALQKAHQTFVLIADLEANTIANAIDKLLNNSDLYNILAKNCQVAARTLHWENEERILLGIWEKVFQKQAT